MKKSDGKWASLMAFITLILSACSSRDKILERNEKPLATSYASFQELNENYQSADFEVKLICKADGYPHPIRVYPSINKQWIIQADADKNEETRGDMNFYKLNGDGNITDTLFLPYKGYWAELIDDFMVFTKSDKAYYTTWPLNSDTTRQTFKVLNADLTWSVAKVNSQIADAKANAKYWFYKNESNNGNYYLKLYYYQNKEWQILWQKVADYPHLGDNESAGRYCTEVLRTGEIEPYLAADIDYLHHHPLEKLSYMHNIGGGSPGFSTINWRGKAFFKTKINNKDFNFFEPNIAVENEKFDGHKNRFYSISGPGASSNAFTPLFYKVPNSFAFYTSNRNKLYLIKQKIPTN